MTYQEAIKEMKAGNFKPVYFVHGDEPYFMDLITDYVENKVLSESEKAFNFTVVYGRDTDHLAIIDAARRYPMMAERQVLILKEAQAMRDLVKLEKYVSNPMPSTLLLICYKHKKLDMRTSFAKALKKNCVVIESSKIYENKVPDWINKYISGKGYSIGPQAVQMLAEYLGNDLSKLTNELDKLLLNLEKGKEIKTPDIQKHVGISKDYNVFELQNALADRNIVKANRIINYFIANPKQHPIQKIIGALYNFFSKVYIYHFNSQKGEKELLKALNLRSAWFLRDYKKAAMRYSKYDLEQVIAVLSQYDLRSKGVENDSTPQEALMQEMIWKILHTSSSISSK
ncbi:MAG: DNA polymerase III subunit delta [Bacteroidota bacterium]